MPKFTDIGTSLGIDFRYDTGQTASRLMVEATGGGAGWLDYDRDGWLDLYLVQGGSPNAVDRSDQPTDELFRNVFGTAFERVTESAGVVEREYGQGVSVADFDDDGFDDIYVTNVGANDRLFQNQGDGTFLDVTAQAGIDNPLWGTSAAWFDLDGDQDLDLYVCNYVDYDPRNPVACYNKEDGKPGTCHPENVDAVPDKFFLNNGDGTFREESAKRGLVAPDGKSLGVVIADLNGDRLPDVFVANDTTANHYFVNRGDGTFEDRAMALGCAMSGLGTYQACMGVGFGDYDRNGFQDLYVTNFTTDSNTLYRNLGAAGFEDVTRQVQLHRPTLPYLGFGTVMSDFDCDGEQNLFIANGHIDDWRFRGEKWKMPAQLFSYDGREWHEHTLESGDYFRNEWLGRAVASADFDRDGDMDLAVVHQNDPMSLLRNDSPRGHWLTIRFICARQNRRGVGTVVTVTSGDKHYKQQLAGGTSYCASHEPALFFGLGSSAESCDVEIEWPDRSLTHLRRVAVDQVLVIQEEYSSLGSN